MIYGIEILMGLFLKFWWLFKEVRFFKLFCEIFFLRLLSKRNKNYGSGVIGGKK